MFFRALSVCLNMGGASTWIPVISSIDTVCRLLYGAFALFGTYCFVCGILTHATTHGATRTCPCIFFMFFNFNSRDHARRDQSGRYEQTEWHYFNSRAHARRDPIAHVLCRCGLYFNSRAHARRDVPAGCRLPALRRISTHAPTQGATI